jgi:hypothetical protein
MMSFNDRVIESVVYRRVAPLLMVAAFVLAIAAVAGTYVNGRADAERNATQIKTAADNAKVACENANESRAASRALWNYVVDISLAGNKDATPEELAFFGEFRDWIDGVYAPHDCDDLSRKYPLPSPPAAPVRPAR